MTVIVRELATGRRLEGRFAEIDEGKVVLWSEMGVYKGTGRTYGFGRRQEIFDYSRVEVLADDISHVRASSKCRVGLWVNGSIKQGTVMPEKSYHGNSLRLTTDQFEELAKDSFRLSLRALVHKYNVSHETIRNYLRKGGISTHRQR